MSTLRERWEAAQAKNALDEEASLRAQRTSSAYDSANRAVKNIMDMNVDEDSSNYQSYVDESAKLAAQYIDSTGVDPYDDTNVIKRQKGMYSKPFDWAAKTWNAYSDVRRKNEEIAMTKHQARVKKAEDIQKQEQMQAQIKQKQDQMEKEKKQKTNKDQFDLYSYASNLVSSRNPKSVSFNSNGRILPTNTNNPFLSNMRRYSSNRRRPARRATRRTTRRRTTGRTRRVRRVAKRRGARFPKITRTYVRGRGRYTLSTKSTLGQTVPVISRRGQEGSVIMSRTEYLGPLFAANTPTAFVFEKPYANNVVSAKGSKTTGAFVHTETVNSTEVPVAYKFLLNPGLPALCPWFSEIAKKYERYRIKKMVFTFQSTTNTEIAVGEICMAHQVNPYGGDLTTKEQFRIMSMQNAMRPDRTFSCGVEANPRLTAHDWKYIRTESLNEVNSQRRDEFDYGSFFIASFGAKAQNQNNQPLGDVHVTFEIELAGPQLHNALNGQSLGTAPGVAVSSFDNPFDARTANTLDRDGAGLGANDVLTNPNFIEHQFQQNWCPSYQAGTKKAASSFITNGKTVAEYNGGSYVKANGGYVIPDGFLEPGNNHAKFMFATGGKFVIRMPPRLVGTQLAAAGYAITTGDLLGEQAADTVQAYPQLSLFPVSNAGRINCTIDQCNIPVILSTEAYTRGVINAGASSIVSRSVVEFCPETRLLSGHLIRFKIRMFGQFQNPGQTFNYEFRHNSSLRESEFVFQNCELIQSRVGNGNGTIGHASYDPKWRGVDHNFGNGYAQTRIQQYPETAYFASNISTTVVGFTNALANVIAGQCSADHYWEFVIRVKNPGDSGFVAGQAVKVGIPALSEPTCSATGVVDTATNQLAFLGVVRTTVDNSPSNSFGTAAGGYQVCTSYNQYCDAMQYCERSMTIEMSKDENGGTDRLISWNNLVTNEFFINPATNP